MPKEKVAVGKMELEIYKHMLDPTIKRVQFGLVINAEDAPALGLALSEAAVAFLTTRGYTVGAPAIEVDENGDAATMIPKMTQSKGGIN